ncbi:MAG: hypothetical protein K8I82_32025 [Anaerolineae bacterium]|nr:hypothetical protein [Anaerolineae bacterium]
MTQRIVMLIIFLGMLFSGNVLAQEDVTSGLPGGIAYIGTDGNVYTVEFANNRLTMLTQDGTIDQPYTLPTWSSDNRLAYFRLSVENGFPTTGVYISNDGLQNGDLVYTGTDEIVNYAYWSPMDCGTGEKCRDLAVLLSTPAQGGLSIQMIRDSLSGVSHELVGNGSPFYYSWSPDGKQMLWQRNQQQLDIYHVAGDVQIDTLSQLPGAFQSPGWSPVDDRWLVGLRSAADNTTTDLAVVTPNTTQVIASRLAGPIAFTWSPNGNYIAYKDRFGPLLVVDAVTGRVVVQSEVAGVFAFFWSPDSKHIAYLTLAAPSNSLTAQAGGVAAAPALLQQTSPDLAWSVLDIEGGVVRRYGAFSPTREMWYLIAFFDQFAQSHHVWSPDSRFIVYSEQRGVDSLVNVIDVTQESVVPFAIASGVIGIWSFNEFISAGA